MATIEALTKAIIEFRDAREWKQFHNPKDTAISLTLEAAELLEHFQWKNAGEIEAHIASHKEEIGEELSDILYWVLLMSHDLGVDIGEAFMAKLRKNEEKYPVAAAKGSHKKYTEL